MRLRLLFKGEDVLVPDCLDSFTCVGDFVLLDELTAVRLLRNAGAKRLHSFNEVAMRIDGFEVPSEDCANGFVQALRSCHEVLLYAPEPVPRQKRPTKSADLPLRKSASTIDTRVARYADIKQYLLDRRNGRGMASRVPDNISRESFLRQARRFEVLDTPEGPALFKRATRTAPRRLVITELPEARILISIFFNTPWTPLQF